MGQRGSGVVQIVGGAAALEVPPCFPVSRLRCAGQCGQPAAATDSCSLVFLPQLLQIQMEKLEAWLFHLFLPTGKILPGHLFLLFEMCFFYHLPATGTILMEVGSEREQKAPLRRGRPNKGQRHSLSLWVVRKQRTNVQNSPGKAAKDAFPQCSLGLCDTDFSLGLGAQSVAMQQFFSWCIANQPGN